MNYDTTIRAQAEAAKLMEPGMRAFNYPAIHTQTAPVLGPTAGDLRINPTLAQLLAMRFRIVGTIRIQLLRSLARSSHLPRNRLNLIDQGHHLFDVRDIGTGHGDLQRHALRIGHYMLLAARLAAIRGILGPVSS